VRTKDEVYGVIAKAVLGQADLGTHAIELVAEIVRLVQESQRMHITKRLHDAQVDSGNLSHGFSSWIGRM
jgi:hypothetical protein